jgi:hypothetical protein
VNSPFTTTQLEEIARFMHERAQEMMRNSGAPDYVLNDWEDIDPQVRLIAMKTVSETVERFGFMPPGIIYASAN